MKMKSLLILVLLCSQVQAMEIAKRNLYYRMGDVSVKHDNNQFKVTDEEGESIVPSYKLDPNIRGISTARLKNILEKDNAYLKLSKDSQNRYGIDLQGRLNGGGPVLANVLYWTVKTLGIGVPSYIAATVAGKAIDQIPGSERAKEIIGETADHVMESVKSACVEMGPLAGISLVPPGEGVVHGFFSAGPNPSAAAYEAAMRNIGLGNDVAQAAAHAAYREAAKQMVQGAAATATTTAVGGVGLKALAGKSLFVGSGTGKMYVTFKVASAGTTASTTSSLAIMPTASAGATFGSSVAGNLIGREIVNKVGTDTAGACGATALVASNTTIGDYVAGVEAAALGAYAWGLAQPVP